MKIDFPAPEQTVFFKALWQEAFGDSDDFVENFFSTVFSEHRCRCVTLDGALAGMLFWFDCHLGEEKFAYLYAVATAKACRNRGICKTLLEDTHRILKDSGYAGAVLVPGEPGLITMYQKMGYACFGGIEEVPAEAGNHSVALKNLTAQEYACLRRQFLPVRGLVQEAENLAFLQTQAQLFAGEDFLLAAQPEGDCLRGLEYLGDPTRLPGILQTLNKKKGLFRTPGNKPFAMVHMLKDAPKPQYFGLAFD